MNAMNASVQCLGRGYRGLGEWRAKGRRAVGRQPYQQVRGWTGTGVMVQWGARYSTCRLSRKGEMGYKDRAHGRGQEQSTRHACGAAFMTQWTDGRDSGERMGLWQENDERMMMITPSREGDWGQGAWHACAAALMTQYKYRDMRSDEARREREY
jgi:hypothetical protein